VPDGNTADKNDREQTDRKTEESSEAVNVSGSTAKSSTGSKSSGGSQNTNKSGSASQSDNAHTHKWADYTAKKQVWVSKMVTVDDYETKTISGARFYTMSGDNTYVANGPTYWFENGFTQADLKAIIST